MSRPVSTGDWQNAVKAGNLNVLKDLYRASLNLNAHDSSQRTALHWAAALGKLEIVDYLVKAKADIEATDKAGRTALHLATGYGELDVVKYLVNDARLDVGIPDDDGKDALQIAYSMKKRPVQEAIVHVLENAPPPIRRTPEADIQEDAVTASQPFRCGTPDASAQTEWGNVAFLKAARDGKVNTVKKLLREGKANLRAKDKDGWTAVHWAAAEARLEVLRFLVLEAKAEANAKDNDGGTPIDLARMFDKEDVMEFLSAAQTQAQSQPPAIVDAASPVVSSAPAASERKARVEQANQALIRAAKEGSLESVMSLLNDKAHIGAKNENGDTALHLAVRHNHSDVVDYLLELKAPINVANHNGETPLRLAEQQHKESATVAQQLRTAAKTAQLALVSEEKSEKETTEHSTVHYEPSMPGSVNLPSTVINSPSRNHGSTVNQHGDEPSARLSVMYPNSVLVPKKLPPVRNKPAQGTQRSETGGARGFVDNERSVITETHGPKPSVVDNKRKSPTQRAAAHLVTGIDSEPSNKRIPGQLAPSSLRGADSEVETGRSCHCLIL